MHNVLTVNQLLPFSAWFNILLALIISTMALHLLFCLLIKNRERYYLKITHHILSFFSTLGKMPFIAFVALYLIYFSLLIVKRHTHYHILPELIDSFIIFIESSILLLLLFNSATLILSYISNWLKASHHVNLYIFLNSTENSLKSLLFIIGVNALVPLLTVNQQTEKLIASSIRLLLIGTIGWVVVQVINSIELVIINKIRFDQSYFTDRKKITQVKILKKSIVFIALFITISSMLMVFDSVRNLGAGLLTTAGIIGAAGAFASQRSLASLFSGLKIAFTQPIAIGDKVIIENEFGQVEDITFSYVIIKLWDLRRLILPIDYFNNKSVFNLTRSTTSELLGTVFLYVDFAIPIEILRGKFNQVLNESSLWDGKTASLQVTDLKEHSVELRAVISAANAEDLWNLRCEIREKLLNFIVVNFPQALPKVRCSLEKDPLHQACRDPIS